MNDKTLLPKEALLYVAMVVIGFGASNLGTNIVNASVALLVGVGIILLRAYLKKQGWEIGKGE